MVVKAYRFDMLGGRTQFMIVQEAPDNRKPVGLGVGDVRRKSREERMETRERQV